MACVDAVINSFLGHGSGSDAMLCGEYIGPTRHLQHLEVHLS